MDGVPLVGSAPIGRNVRPHSDLQAVVSKRRHGSAGFTATHQDPHPSLSRAMESVGSRLDSVGFDPRFSQERNQPRPIEDRHVRDLYRSVRIASSRRLPPIEPTHHGLADVHRQSLPSRHKAGTPQLPMRQISSYGPLADGGSVVDETLGSGLSSLTLISSNWNTIRLSVTHSGAMP